MQIASSHQIGEGCQIIGIKKAPSKDGTKMYTTYYAVCPWTAYELGREDFKLEGIAVQEFQTVKEFDISLGDIVKFYYGRAIGSFQPIEDFKLLCRASDIKDGAGKSH